MKINETVKLLESDGIRTPMARFYGEDGVEANIKRCEDLLAGYEKMLGGEGDVMLLSSSGRTGISSNHTDHNHGKVLAGSINLGCVGVIGENESSQVHTISETYNQDFTIDLNHLEPSEKKARTVDLVKGLLQEFKDSGYSTGGFNACITSNIISATGVSSSASSEMLLCSMLNTFFNESRMNTVAYAHIDRFAEDNYWDRASGLLDQMACAVGGLIIINFMEPSTSKMEEVDLDFDSQNHSLITAQTGKGYANLNTNYSMVPVEMKKVARYFGRGVSSQVSEEQVIDDLAEVRQFAKGRSVPRASHFFKENKRVETEMLTLRKNRFQDFLTDITTSGNSSWKWFRNYLTNSNYQEQGIATTLTPTELFIAGKRRGAYRIHGGGSAGVIMAVLPNEPVDKFIHYTGKCTGEGNAYRISARPRGAVCSNDLV